MRYHVKLATRSFLVLNLFHPLYLSSRTTCEPSPFRWHRGGDVKPPFTYVITTVMKNELRINLINPIFIKPLDKTCLLQLINTDIYVYDNTSVFEGFSSAVLAFYNSYNKNIHYFTLPNEYIKHGKYNADRRKEV